MTELLHLCDNGVRRRNARSVGGVDAFYLAADREMTGEGAAPAHFAVDFQAALVAQQHVFYDRQPQPGAAGGP